MTHEPVTTVTAGHFRPHLHFTPQRHWINDPNGLVYADGDYHLYYQYNPHGDQWGHVSWGHAVSRDLLSWEQWPVALHERPDHLCFSGSAVHDRDNTSGLGTAQQAPLVAVYTGVRVSDGRQAQYLAHSLDGGLTWEQGQQPVLDIGSTEFRDPRVFWCAAMGRWTMLVAHSSEHRLSFYASPDLHHWTHLSDFGPQGQTGGVWECPELLQLEVDGEPGERAWMLKVDLNPGGPWGGSGTLYWLGDFGGAAFVPQGPARWVDHGQDFYAAQAWLDAPGGPVWLGWMSNWQYAPALPTAPWRGAMTLPRHLSLRREREGEHGLTLVQRPVKSLEARRGGHWQLPELVLQLGKQLPELPALTCFELIAEFEVSDPQSALGLRLRAGATTGTLVGYDAAAGQLSVDRRASGPDFGGERFAERHTAPLTLPDGHLHLHLIVDACSVEVFAQNGSVVLTDLIFPADEDRELSLYVEGGPVRLLGLDLWALEPSNPS